jgi:tripartite-type tricarboxylate transporter receptor subunit TctC
MIAFRTTACVTLIAAAFAQPVAAQSFPGKPIRIVIGFTPGGGVDINARLLAPKMSELLGQQVVVENRPGAGTNIANELVARAAPDGYTLLMNTAAVAINMSLYKKVAYDALKDYAPISVFSNSPNVLVIHSSVPVRTVKQLVALAKSRPGVLNFSSAGSGTTQHLSGELFKLRTSTNVVHIPYKGSAPSLTAIIGGESDMTFANIPAIYQHVKSGRLRPLATTGVKRAEQLSEVPTFRESGYDVEVVVWYGVFAPAATPKDVIGILSNTIMKSANSPDIRQRLLDQGAEPVGNRPEEFAKDFREELARWAEVVRISGARAD